MPEQLKCPNCGAPINRATMRCDYCGAVFKDDAPLVERIYFKRPGVRTLASTMMLDREEASLPGVSEYVRNSMAYRLAKELAKVMELEVQEDPVLRSVRINGRVRIVMPGEDSSGWW